jgi:hypothetical protein
VQLVDARTALIARGFDELTPTRLNEVLNLAKNQFEDGYPFPWLETTATGPAPLTIADLKDVLYVVDTTNQNELRGVPAQHIIAEQDPIIGDTGAPALWWLDGTTSLKTWPVQASAQLSVRYVKESPELSLDADTPLIPVRYHSTWVDLAAVRAYLDSDNIDAAAQLSAIVGQDLARIIARYDTRNRQNSAYQQILGYAEDW